MWRHKNTIGVQCALEGGMLFMVRRVFKVMYIDGIEREAIRGKKKNKIDHKDKRIRRPKRERQNQREMEIRDRDGERTLGFR